MTPLIINDEQFDAIFKPIKNHIDDNASWSGNMFETYGKELEYVQKRLEEAPETVWTIIDCGEHTCISSGFHHVNRLGYIITEIGSGGQVIEVYDEDDMWRVPPKGFIETKHVFGLTIHDIDYAVEGINEELEQEGKEPIEVDYEKRGILLRVLSDKDASEDMEWLNDRIRDLFEIEV